MTKEDLDKAIKYAAEVKKAKKFFDPSLLLLSKALLHLAEEKETWGNEFTAVHSVKLENKSLEQAVREADGILDQINPDAKMSDTRETLARRVYNYGAMAKEWRAKYGGKWA